MNQKPDWSLEANQASSSSFKPQEQESIRITLQLPSVLAMALQERSRQSGQSQAEVILHLLQTACGLTATVAEPSAEQVTRQELQALIERLRQLETLLPRLEIIEGKLIAF
jgi:hypothetical protein